MEKEKKINEDEFEEVEGLAFWSPKEEGETIEGEVTKVSEGEYGEYLVLKNDKGEEITTGSHKWLQNLIKNVTVGDYVKILYEGEEPPSQKGWNPTKKFKLFRKKK